ncbi:MAG TPA: hypothetical protein V6D29_01125 [Leptolyngbyaceae cyanobacterium]
MLPQILPESRLSTFKFWFNGKVQDGLHYQHDLYYRARTVKTDQRSRLYQLACRLTERHARVVMTAGYSNYSLWISLRNQKLAAIALHQATQLPSADFSGGEPAYEGGPLVPVQLDRPIQPAP